MVVIKTHKVLKNLRKNSNIVVLNPDEGNGVVAVNTTDYVKDILDIINDTNDFAKLESDPTINRGSLQRLLCNLQKNGKIDKDSYNSIYPSGSQPAHIYGLPKMPKIQSSNAIPPFRSIVSSVNTYNYQLAKYLFTLLRPFFN